MEKKSVSIKKTATNKSRRKGARVIARRTGRLAGAFSSFLAHSFAHFCYKKRKALSFLFILSVLFFAAILSYHYVQAKMNETDSFSDTYILEKVSRHMSLPSGKPLSLVRVEDPARLQKENPFYATIKEGDYIIAYPRLFIIYDAVHDEIEGTLVSSRKE